MADKRANIITNIEWERIFLNIEISSDEREGVAFVHNAKTSEKYPLESVKTENGFRVSINMACVHDREFLENGRWTFVIESNGHTGRIAVSNDVAKNVENLSRVFRYAENQMAYTVSFGIETGDEKSLDIYMDSYFLEENRKWKKRRYVREVRSPRDKLKRFAMAGAVRGIGAWYHIVNKFAPLNGKNVLIMSETHDYLWGNLKAIDDEIKAQKLQNTYKISYLFDKNAEGKVSVRNAIAWMRSARIIAKQDIIFIDDYAPIFGFFKLSDKTKLVQVWHAGVGFKSVGYARFGKEGSPFPQKSSHKQYTNATVGSEQLREVYSEVFGIEKDACLPLGMPRMDNFLDDDKQKKIKEDWYSRYPQTEGKNIVLFAPTYRGAEQKDAYYDYNWLDLDKISEFCEKTDSVWLFKMHPFVKDTVTVPADCNDRIIQLDSTYNINDLYFVSDVLITDYSSNYYEFALTGGACVFFTPDREIYELTRGVHKSVKESAPGKVCDSFEELMKALYSEDYEMEKTGKFVEDNFGEYTGDASKKIVERFLK